MIQGVHRSDVELIEAMDESTSMMTRASSALLGAIAEFDDRSLWELHGTSMTQWLAARYSLVYATASEWLRVARALKSLPAIAAAYANGKLSWDQLRPLTKFATPETDERWAREAPSWTCAGLWQEWRPAPHWSRR